MDAITSEAHEVNKRRWNEVTPVHVGSEFYDVEGFVGGCGTIGEVERAAVGDVAGKRLLHLQCHFGMDTLSWVRLGVKRAVGIDFSDVALAAARHLAERTGLADRVTFIEADVTKAGRVEGGNFDVVFTSMGTILWLDDLDGWAATIGANLARSGFFYFLDSHPLQMVFDETSTEAGSSTDTSTTRQPTSYRPAMATTPNQTTGSGPKVTSSTGRSRTSSARLSGKGSRFSRCASIRSASMPSSPTWKRPGTATGTGSRAPKSCR